MTDDQASGLASHAKLLYERRAAGLPWPGWDELDERAKNYWFDLALKEIVSGVKPPHEPGSNPLESLVAPFAIPVLNWLTRFLDRLSVKVVQFRNRRRH